MSLYTIDAMCTMPYTRDGQTGAPPAMVKQSPKRHFLNLTATEMTFRGRCIMGFMVSPQLGVQ